MSLSKDSLRCPSCQNVNPMKLNVYIHDDIRLGFYCEKCSKESYFDENGHPQLKIPRYIKKATTNGLSPIIKVSVETISELKPGMHVCWRRKSVYYHHAIILSAENRGEQFQVFHRTKENGNTQIFHSTLWFEKHNENMFVVEYERDEEDSVAWTLARAKSRLGHTGYNLVSNNCEHFARFCKTGVEHSEQSWKALQEFATKVAVFLVKMIEEGVIIIRKATRLASKSVSTTIIFVIEGISIAFDFLKYYDLLLNGTVTTREFMVEMGTRCGKIGGGFLGLSIMETVILFTIGTVAMNPMTLVGCMALGGVFGQCAGQYCGEKIGKTVVGSALTWLLDYDEKMVSDIERGDHLIVFGNLAHPRCHVIVLDVERDVIEVLRFTHARGVIVKKIARKRRMRKVIHLKPNKYPVEDVIERAKSCVHLRKDYSIYSYNCKHFIEACFYD